MFQHSLINEQSNILYKYLFFQNRSLEQDLKYRPILIFTPNTNVVDTTRYNQDNTLIVRRRTINSRGAHRMVRCGF